MNNFYGRNFRKYFSLAKICFFFVENLSVQIRDIFGKLSNFFLNRFKYFEILDVFYHESSQVSLSSENFTNFWFY